MSLQLSIDDAIQAGERGMALAHDKAQRQDPTFGERAAAIFLSHLRVVGQASGEDLTDIARAHGLRAADGRAFGAVFRMLNRCGKIRCVRSDLPRKRGHGTSGGKLWSICE